MRKETKFKLLFIVIVTLIFFSVGEIVLRFTFPKTSEYKMWPPGLEMTFTPHSDFINGIDGDSKFVVNSVGLRGDEIPSDAKRMLAIGGSTTINTYLDQRETWPILLQKELSSEESVWIGNAGKSGLNSFHHIDQMKTLLSQIENVSTVFMLVGINDLQLKLVRGEYEAGDETDIKKKIYQILPDADLQWYKNMGWWKLARALKHKFVTKAPQSMVLDRSGESTKRLQGIRSDVQHYIDEVPDWTSALELYRKNLKEIISISKEKNVELVLLTQPVLWNDHNSLEEESKLWMGGMGNFQEKEGSDYLNSLVLYESMSMFNETLKSVAKENNVQVIDLFSKVESTIENFYDDCHFTEKGAQKVAEIIVNEYKN